MSRIRLIVLSLLLLAGCASVKNPVTGQREFSAMDEKSEVAAGKKANAQVLEEYSAYADPRVQAYVNELGQRLAHQSHRSKLEWHFTVLDTNEVNAFALPGGYVYVTRGLLAYMESEADLAGVIGHEIGHVTARHGAQRATRQQTAGIGVLAATLLGAVLEAKGVSGATDMASSLSQGVAAGIIASYSREQETQADELGAEYLARNNYDPKRMIEVIGMLKSQEQYAADTARAEGRQASSGGGWLASHPSNDKRLADIVKFAAQYKGNYGNDGRPRYLQAIEGLTFGESRDQGVTRGRNFYHEPLGIALSAPEGWRVLNSNEALLLLNAAGDAGLVIQAVMTDKNLSQEAVLRDVLKLQQTRTQRLTLGGFPAIHFTGVVRNEDKPPQSVEATLVTGPSGRHLLMLYGSKDARALERARGPLREAENSFRTLSAADRAAARPWALKTQAYPRGGFAELARTAPLLGNVEAQLRLLNGAYPGGNPPVGQIVKTVK